MKKKNQKAKRGFYRRGGVKAPQGHNTGGLFSGFSQEAKKERETSPAEQYN